MASVVSARVVFPAVVRLLNVLGVVFATQFYMLGRPFKYPPSISNTIVVSCTLVFQVPLFSFLMNSRTKYISVKSCHTTDFAIHLNILKRIPAYRVVFAATIVSTTSNSIISAVPWQVSVALWSLISYVLCEGRTVETISLDTNGR